jgi:hypothetical protein
MAGIIARQRKDGTKGYMECQPDSEPFIFPYDPRGVSSAFTEGCHDPLQHHGPPERCLDIATAAYCDSCVRQSGTKTGTNS